MIRAWLKRRRLAQRARVLDAVRAAPGSTVAELMAVAHVSYYAVGVHLSELRMDGLVTRYWTGDPFGRGRVHQVWVPLDLPDAHDDEQDGDAVTSGYGDHNAR